MPSSHPAIATFSQAEPPTRTELGSGSHTTLASTPERQTLATLVDELSNRLQVVLGYAQILHELDEHERRDAVAAIGRECDRLRATLRSLTSSARDEDGLAPWQSERQSETPEA